MTLRAAGSVPPMVLPAPVISTPCPLPAAAVPADSVPMKLPAITFPLEARTMPAP